MMGQQRYGFVALATLAGLLFSGDVRGAVRETIRPVFKNIDPDENSEPVPEDEASGFPELLFAGASGSCQAIGGSTTQASGQFRYRGNVLHIDANDAAPTEFKMSLRFSGTTDLSFSIHERDVEAIPEVWNRIFERTHSAVGNGLFQLYSSGPINLKSPTLKPNTDYAFGVSWAGTTVFFVRNNVTQPKPLAANIGESYGLVTLNGVQPPVDATIPPPTISTVGVYAMEFCFEPVAGACCLSTAELCLPLKASECTEPGSTFHGERESCGEINCYFGACCSPCDNHCDNRYTPEACTVEGGTHHRSAQCPIAAGGLAEFCPESIGACCTGANCSEKCPNECTASGGTYQGDGTDCTPDVCEGACCIPNASVCTSATQNTCTVFFGGQFRGYGTECALLFGADNPNDPNDAGECGGACCFSGGISGCRFVAARALCNDSEIPNAIYLGDATSCGQCPNISTVAACCLPDGTCLNTSASVCSSLLGIPDSENRTCGDEDRVACVKKGCCNADGICQFRPTQSCLDFGDTPTDSCDEGICSQALPSGACCVVGGCNEVTESTCTADNGIYKGDASTCDQVTCDDLGSCCTPENTCVEPKTASQCALLAGDFHLGLTCFDEDVDCDNRGACCLPSGGCAFLDPDDCAAVGGSYKGEAIQCQAIGICPSGACCLGDGTCAVRAPHACNNPQEGLIYQGNGSTCTAGKCTLGACCPADGNCVDELVRSQCLGINDSFGPGQTCAADSCAVAACCLDTFDGTCQDLSRVQCVAAGGVYRADSNCDAAPQQCVLGSCCAIDGVCEDDKFSFQCPVPSDFRNTESCLTQPCEIRGACCTPGNPQCRILTPLACSQLDGTYNGDATSCEADLCAVGACCNHMEGCQQVTLQACRATDSTYKGPGTTCVAAECPLTCHDVVVSTSPADCAVDPGYPHTPQESPARLRWKTLDFTFECAARTLIPTAFSVREEPVDGTPRAIVSVEPVAGDPNGLRLTFDQFIKIGRWTCVTHIVSEEEVCIGFLPGDVNADGESDQADLTALEDNLSGGPTLPIEKCDIDRSGGCYPTDLINEIDLQNGADPKFDKTTTLPACPAAP